MADSKLVFTRPADGLGRLIFNDSVDTVAQSAEIGVDAVFDGDSDCVVQLLWDANVFRGELQRLQSPWESAAPAAARVESRWQHSLPTGLRNKSGWQDSVGSSGRAASCWQSSERFGARVGAGWQDAQRLRSALQAGFQEAIRLHSGAASRWQDGDHLRSALLSGYQEAIRLRAPAATRWQDGAARGVRISHRRGAGLPVNVSLDSHWQDGRRPPVGLSVVPVPVDPGGELCYDPATLGRLVFSEQAAANGRLVFRCVRGGEQPGAAIVVPVRSVYMVHNSVTLHRVPSGAEFEAVRFGLQIDADSRTFSWSATLIASARQHLVRSTPGERVEVECSVNGFLLRLVVSSISRDRAFPEQHITVSGLGRAAPLGDVDLSFGNSTARTAQQLMLDVLTVNGASLGWAVDWGITDWLVPADAWVFRGSYLGALQDIAEAVGAYIQPHPTGKTLRVLPRYPHAPWDWTTLLAPDIELPQDVVSIEGREEIIRQDYNRVFVGGLAQGVFGPVTRGGTPGDKVAPPITHPLITAAAAHRQSGLRVLSDTGLQEHLSLKTMVLSETGIILPGKVLRYVDDDGPRLGIVRKTSVQMDEWPVLHQTLGVETHVG